MGPRWPACSILWVFVSFHFTSSGSRLGPWPEPGSNPLRCRANRQGAVVFWGGRRRLWLCRASSSLCFREPERTNSGCCGPLPSPPLRPDNETDGPGSFFDRPCLLCRNASAPTEASPRGRRPWEQGHTPGSVGLDCFVDQARRATASNTRAWEHAVKRLCVGGQIEGC